MAETVSFYSFKGGVGRSLTLANVAVQLANKGKKIVCIDFDLEAGGLHTIFDIPPKNIKNTMLDIINNSGPFDLQHSMIDITQLLPNKDSAGKLWLLPTVSETTKLNDAMQSGRNLPKLLGDIIEDLTIEYNPHFVFIDSRTGFSELAAAPIAKTQHLICILRPNKQNAEGLRLLLDILENVKEKPKPFVVLSQVPIGVPEAENRINKIQELLGAERRFDARIPYLPELALEERVISITAPDSTMARSYYPIIKWLEEKING